MDPAPSLGQTRGHIYAKQINKWTMAKSRRTRAWREQQRGEISSWVSVWEWRIEGKESGVPGEATVNLCALGITATYEEQKHWQRRG